VPRRDPCVISTARLGDRELIVTASEDVPAHKCGVLDSRERERFLNTLMTNLQGMVYRCANDARWTLEFTNAGCAELTGYPPEALIGNAEVVFEDLIVAEYREATRREAQGAIARNEAWTLNYPIVTATGATKWVCECGTAVRDAHGDIVALEGLITDHTAHRETEERLIDAAAAAWRHTFDAIHDSLALFDAEGRILRCNTATCAASGRELEDLLGHHCFEVFHGTSEPIPDCPRVRAIESGKVETMTREVGGCWLHVSFHPTCDAQANVIGGVHVVTDITDLKHAEQRLIESVARQQAITDGTIATLARVIEARDPYTAGHVRRVSELAVAIAGFAGLDEDCTNGVRVAGMVHDVGKITIPADILAKPGRLSAGEFELIKEHSQAGFDILGAIDFPWPVAEIALQHHERLDGSGYPRGLGGKELLFEARILAVADVVEAMSSHRPYRPALGVEAALDEIRCGAGRLYDTRAVQACVELFAHRDFAFTQ
jgi:PAS domain S-box-containing protein